MAEQQAMEQIKSIIEGLLQHMTVAARVEFEDSITQGLIYNIQSSESYLLIGRQGAHLHALQILAQQLAVKQLGYGSVPRFTIDVDDYRRKRQWHIKELIRGAVEKAKRTGRPVTLEPMPNYERRLIHAYVQDHFGDATTESIGGGSSRRVVIKPR